ncbi:LemA family protein [Marinicellulosiphila megalodicopiae]|uniref:LemA family protein n=1 Tax=Marinicellulosiphila megalodicopiae TaxID=2724896 RepID=UPI003BB1D53B
MATLFLLIGGTILLNIGMSQMKEMRDFYNLKIAPIGIMVKGDYLVYGIAESLESTLITPIFDKQVLMYDYKIEKSYKNLIDDKIQWKTIIHKFDMVDFNLADTSGKVRVRLKYQDSSNIDYVHEKVIFEDENRHTLRWIESADEFYLYGNKPNENSNTFILSPSIDTPYFIKKNNQELSLRGEKGLINIWLAITLITIAVIILFLILKKHKIIEFMAILALVQIVLLTVIGGALIKRDISQITDNVHQQNINFKILDGTKSGQVFIEEYYQQLYSNADYQLNKFPNNIVTFLSFTKLPDASFDILPNNIGNIYLKHDYMIAVLGIITLLLIAFLKVGLKLTIAKRSMENIPTSKVKGAMVGLSEIKGTVIEYQNQGLISPLTSRKCCWYDYKVEGRQDEGDNESPWVTFEHKKEKKLFKCTDESGCEIIINPSKADVSIEYSIVKVKGGRRYTETCISFNQSIYLFGYLSVGYSSGQLMMKSEIDQPLIISNYSDKSIVLKKGLIAMSMMGGVFSLSILFGLICMAITGSFDPGNYLLSAMFILFSLSGIVGILHYNDILFLRNRVNRNFTNIQVSLKKRYDLLGNIQNIVKGYVKHEHELLQTLSILRSNFNKVLKEGNATPNRVKKILKQYLEFNKIFDVISEEYPELKSDELIRDFIYRQSDVENEISLICEGYNDSINHYNTRIQSFPDVVLAKVFGFSKKTNI